MEQGAVLKTDQCPSWKKRGKGRFSESLVGPVTSKIPLIPPFSKGEVKHLVLIGLRRRILDESGTGYFSQFQCSSGISTAYAKTRFPFLSRISPLPSAEEGMFSGPILSSLTLTWP